MTKIPGKKVKDQTNESNGAALEVDDIDWAVTPHLYGSVKTALKTKVMAEKDSHYQVRYVVMRGSATKVEECGKKIAELINEVCCTYQVVGSLSSAIKFDLFWEPDGRDKEPQALYLKYIAFTPQAAKVIDLLLEAKLESPFFKMGEMPTSVME